MKVCKDFETSLRDKNYSVTIDRSPDYKPVELASDWLKEIKGPEFDRLKYNDNDLTRHGLDEPIGQKIIVFGNVVDADNRPIPNCLVEIWHANAAGGYRDSLDVSGLPLDPNFYGVGRYVTDEDGCYKFYTIRPGAYPAMYDPPVNAWRAAHIHFSIIGPGCESRLVTQMYFEGDPLLNQDRIYLGVTDEKSRSMLVARFSEKHSVSDSFGPPRTKPTADGSGRLVYPPKRTDDGINKERNPSALAYEFNIVLRGNGFTPLERWS